MLRHGTALVGLIAALAVTGTAWGSILQVPHKPFNRMTRQEKVSFLHRQIRHDHSIIRFSKNHPYIVTSEIRHAVRWAHISLRIASKNLTRLMAVARTPVTSGSVQHIICSVFTGECSYALTIAWRESRYQVGASNGTHWGLFQLGAPEIKAYAHGHYSTALDQTLAAKRLRDARGWQPWTCCEG